MFTGVEADDKQTAIGREFARLHGIEKPYYATPGDGIFHFYFPEQGLVMPGQFIPGADSHSRAYGAYGAVGIGVGSTTLGFGWSTGYIYFTLAQAAARRLQRAGCSRGSAARTSCSSCCGAGARSSRRGCRSSSSMPQKQLPIAYRNTIANMMAEAEALNGIFAPDDDHVRVVSREGHHDLPYPRDSRPARTRVYEIDETLDLSDVRPMIAKPFSPGNAFPADEVARERIAFDKAMIGSCTNGSYDDLLQAALVLRAARGQGVHESRTGVRDLPRLGRRRPADRDGRIRASAASRSRTSSARSAAQIRQSWCGPCFGQGPDALTPGQRAITSFNRNWQNRMGVGGEGYLASPAVVAASALLGYMAPPSELGLDVGRGALRRVSRDHPAGVTAPGFSVSCFFRE